MKISMTAVGLIAAFVLVSHAQDETQQSISDRLIEDIEVPDPMASEGIDFASSVFDTSDCQSHSICFDPCRFVATTPPCVPVITTSTICNPVQPVVYQESYSTGSITRQQPITNANPIATRGRNTTQTSPGESNRQSNFAVPQSVIIEQGTPFIQPNSAINRQLIGTQISSPLTPGTTINDGAVQSNPTSSLNSNSYPFSGYSMPGNNYNNWCPPNRGFGFRGRIFRRFR